MKILFISNTFIDGKMSGVTHIKELISSLNKSNKIFLIARAKQKNNEQNIQVYKEKIVNSFDFPHINVQWISTPFILIHGLLIGLYAIIKFNPDVIYERYSIYGFSSILGKLFKVPYIVEVNGILYEDFKLLNTSRWKWRISSIHERISLKLSRKIIVVSSNIKKHIHQQYNIPEDKIVVISNGANINLFKPYPKMEMRSKLGLDLKYNYVCFVGNLLPWQGVEYLIHAAPLILEKHSNVRFLIIGDGVMKKELEQLSSDFEISDSFIFTGYTKYEDIPSYISASDICVAPYIKNRTTSPLKIYEYFACGRPVVASNVSDVNDLFIKSEGGICITPEDINELSRAILNLLQNNELRKKMGENGYKYVLENQTWDNVAKKTETIFKDLVFESNK